VNDEQALQAALVQLSELAGRIGALDQREGEHWQQAHAKLQELADLAGQLRDGQASHTQILAALDGVAEAVLEIEQRVANLEPGEDDDEDAPYKPKPARPFWNPAFTGPEREAAVAELEAWVEDILRRTFGYVATGLGGCWTQHTAALTTVDWLSQLWAVLWLDPKPSRGTVAGQAEFTIRILPQAMDQMKAETRGECAHNNARAVPRANGSPR
jgi:hypothetical protein